MTIDSDLLGRLTPPIPWQADWSDVLRRADEVSLRPHGRGRPKRRRLIMAAGLIVAVLIPLVALAAGNDWWFFQFSDAPAPVASPVVVTQGSWAGHRWKLIAYNSKTAGTCWSITFAGSTAPGGTATGLGPGVAGAHGVLGCGSLVGLRLSHINGPFPTVTYMAGSSDRSDYPSWIAGPVVSSATTVVVHLRNGAVLRMPTFRVPHSLGHLLWFGSIRFFAGQLPAGVRSDRPPVSIAGLDARGMIVACLKPSTAIVGASPLADCKG